MKTFRFRSFLVIRVSVEDVIITLVGRTGPDVSVEISPLLYVVQVTKDNLVIHLNACVGGLKLG